MKIIIFLIYFLGLLFLNSLPLSYDALAADYPKNTTLIEETTRKAITDLVSDLESLSLSMIYPEVIDEPESKFLLLTLLADEFSQRNIKLQTSLMDSTTNHLLIQIDAMGLHYPRTYRRWIIGKKQIERYFVTQLTYQLIDHSDQQLVQAGIVRSEYADNIPQKILEKQLQSDIGLNPALKSSSSLWEPLFVSGIAAGLIYLFYSARAD